MSSAKSTLSLVFSDAAQAEACGYPLTCRSHPPSGRPTRARRGAGLFQLVEILFLILNLFFCLGVVKKWFLRVSPLEFQTSRRDPLLPNHSRVRANFLLLGVDSVEGTHRSDTILVAGGPWWKI